MGFYYFLTVISFLNSIILFIGEYSKKLLYNHKSHGDQYMRKYQFLEVVVLKKYYQYFFLNNKVALKPKEKMEEKATEIYYCEGDHTYTTSKGSTLIFGLETRFQYHLICSTVHSYII